MKLTIPIGDLDAGMMFRTTSGGTGQRLFGAGEEGIPVTITYKGGHVINKKVHPEFRVMPDLYPCSVSKCKNVGVKYQGKTVLCPDHNIFKGE